MSKRALLSPEWPGVFRVYRREHRHQLSFEDFFLSFGGKLSGDNRWIKLAELIPWDELEDNYAASFCKGFGAPAKPFLAALGALIIKARLGLTPEELVQQIKENPYINFFTGQVGYQYSAPFDPSMMVYFRKRLPESLVNDCNQPIVHHGLKVIRYSIAMAQATTMAVVVVVDPPVLQSSHNHPRRSRRIRVHF